MPKNTGPDGVNRCGFMRGKKCEQDRYNEEMQIKALNESRIIQTEAEANKPDYTIPFMIFAIILIGFILYFLMKSKKAVR